MKCKNIKKTNKKAVMDDIIDLIGTILIIFILFIFLNFFKASAVTTQKELIENSINEVKTKHYLNTILRMPIDEINESLTGLLEKYLLHKEDRSKYEIILRKNLNNFFKNENIECFSFYLAPDIYSLRATTPKNTYKVCEGFNENTITTELIFYNKTLVVGLYVEYK